MDVKNKKRFRKTKIAIISLVCILLISVVGFFIYVSDYYRAEDIAIEVMQDNSKIEVVDNLTILSPAIPGDTALIFYPGAKVEHIAYFPILKKLTDKGITCVLVEMPFNMAIFDSHAADDVFDKLPEIKNWYIGGHSMGGAMASSYASENKDKVEGLILLGSYVYGDYPAEKALTVYGTFNSNLEEHIDYTENIVVIEGGNHAQFGNYGEQKGDPAATISREEQQNISVDAILNFIEN
ncbi:alpha/beta fold hydrolase [Oceanirhabdus seepicola]|uniref:Alpha/beta fold hydrolase n=1 Tax=Oceanirhabdus seepicola TaxID=2828781 RepID=A0A9J6NX95_9CLOT|nr:alpha/beta fold hydrolase [Oceanirhabdus seepicola]MCM1988883.1 alpha/beta fold hydrolase [Oceanirhabdus seepicola]